MTKQDELIDHIYHVLVSNDGARHVKEIVELLHNERKVSVTENMVDSAFAHLRKMAEKDPDHFGWTSPHVQRGPNSVGDKRYFVALIDSNGDHFVDGDHRYDSVESGAINTVKEAASKLDHLARALNIVSEQYAKQPAAKKMYQFVATIVSNAAKLLRNLMETEVLPISSPKPKRKLKGVIEGLDLDEAA